jgi:hypothetical protein
VLNGQQAFFTRRGESRGQEVGRMASSLNRVEAQLVSADGRAGTWRFDLSPTARLEPGSIRVIAGSAERMTPDSVVFRLKGQPGERVAFTFRLRSR